MAVVPNYYYFHVNLSLASSGRCPTVSDVRTVLTATHNCCVTRMSAFSALAFQKPGNLHLPREIQKETAISQQEQQQHDTVRDNTEELGDKKISGSSFRRKNKAAFSVVLKIVYDTPCLNARIPGWPDMRNSYLVSDIAHGSLQDTAMPYQRQQLPDSTTT